MPCLTAFSTSVCTSIDGTSARPASGAASIAYAQAGAEPGFFDVEVGRGEGQLLIERRPFALRAAQRVAEHLGQLLDGAVGPGRDRSG